VLAGAGPVFSAGHDFGDVTARDLAGTRDLLGLCTDLMRTIQSVPQVVIARVHGLATAAGCQLVASCDLAVPRGRPVSRCRVAKVAGSVIPRRSRRPGRWGAVVPRMRIRRSACSIMARMYWRCPVRVMVSTKSQASSVSLWTVTIHRKPRPG
jgi:hypothetical protein